MRRGNSSIHRRNSSETQRKTGALDGARQPNRRDVAVNASACQRVPLRLVGGAFEPTAVAALRAGEQSVLDVRAEQAARAPGARDERLHLGPTITQWRTVFAQFDVGRRVYLGHMLLDNTYHI